MTGKVTGIATISIDGGEVPSEGGATLNPGGVTRKPKMAGRRVYYSEEPIPPKLELTVLHAPEIDLMALREITDATVLFECDNGQDYMLTGAFVTDPPELNSAEGQIKLSMSARTCERIN